MMYTVMNSSAYRGRMQRQKPMNVFQFASITQE